MPEPVRVSTLRKKTSARTAYRSALPARAPPSVCQSFFPRSVHSTKQTASCKPYCFKHKSSHAPPSGAPVPGTTSARRKPSASGSERLLKKIQPISTASSAYTCPNTRGRRDSAFPSQSFSAVNSTKNHSPHARNVQFAPCQMPVRLQTAKRFRTCRALEQRLPPSGM